MTCSLSASGASYAGVTASMLGDPEAHRFGGASAVFSPPEYIRLLIAPANLGFRILRLLVEGRR